MNIKSRKNTILCHLYIYEIVKKKVDQWLPGWRGWSEKTVCITHLSRDSCCLWVRGEQGNWRCGQGQAFQKQMQKPGSRSPGAPAGSYHPTSPLDPSWAPSKGAWTASVKHFRDQRLAGGHGPEGNGGRGETGSFYEF